MYRLYFAFILTLFSLFSIGQSYTYHSFPDSNITWTGYTWCGFHNTVWYNYWTLHYSKDTVINTLGYHKIGGNTFVREDSSHKVFIFYPYDTTDLPLYDFSLTVGDTFFTDQEVFYVDSVDTLEYNGVQRRTIFGYWGSHYNYDFWIEGIGSSKGPLARRHLYTGPCHDSRLCEATADTTVLYLRNDTVFNKCSDSNSVSDNLPIPLLRVYPNPSKNWFSVHLTQSITNGHFILLDIQGRVIVDKVLASTATRIEHFQFPSGVYIWYLTDDGIVLERGKIILE